MSGRGKVFGAFRRLVRGALASLELLGGVGSRERVGGDGHAEEGAERLPAIAGLEAEQAVRRDRRLDGFEVTVEDLDGGVAVVDLAFEVPSRSRTVAMFLGRLPPDV